MAPIYILRSIPLFKNLSNEDLRHIANRLTKVSYKKGDFIFREDEVGDTMYLVESGQVGVVGRDAGDIAHLGPGSFVGEISLLLAQPRTASLQVMIDAELWALKKNDFEELLSTRPAIGLEMMKELSQRLVSTTRGTRRHVKRQITALVTNRDLEETAAWGGFELAEALHDYFNNDIGILPLPGTAHPPKTVADKGIMVLDNDHLDEAYLPRILSHQVEKYKHVILLVPDRAEELNKKAVSLSDTVVVIGQPSRWLGTCTQKQDVWTTKGVDLDEPGRIARRLTNRTIGLALSSGGSRGLAHLGVFKVLMEENIPIDMVAGTSAGGLFGSFFAASWPWKRYEELVVDMQSANRFPNWDFNIPPRTGILKGRKALKIIERWVDDKNFEELDLPLYIIAADILTGDEVIFNTGSLAQAIRASLSIPVMVEPWHYRNRYFVDGGIVNPLPANILRHQGADIVIASSVIQPLRDSFSGRRDKTPSIFQIVFNIFSSMEAEVVSKQLPFVDILIHHKVSAEHTLDFSQVQDIVKLGEESARNMIPAIKEAIAKPLDL